MINPMSIMKLKPQLQKFRENHPKIIPFFQAASQMMEEGTLLEMSVVNTDGKRICTNMRVKQEDLELVDELRSILAK